jgi:hypothetical protein
MSHPRIEWEGFKINGQTFRSIEVANFCRDFGQAQLLDACQELDLIPTSENIKKLRSKCQEWEDKLL